MSAPIGRAKARIIDSTGFEMRSFEYASATWSMKRPRVDRMLELGSRGLNISTKVLPRDGKTHELAATFTNGLLEVRVDGRLAARETIS